jgi:hypothetical protein
MGQERRNVMKASMETCLAVARRRGVKLDNKALDYTLENGDMGDSYWDLPSAICWAEWRGWRMVYCRVSYTAAVPGKPLFNASSEAALVGLLEMEQDEFWTDDWRLRAVFPGPREDREGVGLERMLELLKTGAVEANGVKLELAWRKPAEQPQPL